VNLDGYVPVNERLRQALDKYPDLRVVELEERVVDIGDKLFIRAAVEVYRTFDDPRPTIGTVWEPWPGRSAFQRDSECMVAFTSALGRALGYMGFGIDRGIASVDEIRARTEDPDLVIERTGPTKKVGSMAQRAAQMAAQAPPDPPPPPEDPEPALKPSGRRKEPTEKMLGFLERLNRERGNPLTAQDVARCAADFDECRRKIDELQEMPKP
jgi:hypothetical protein